MTFRVVWVSPNHGIGEAIVAKPDKSVVYDGRIITIEERK
jgi:hypothetical protein